MLADAEFVRVSAAPTGGSVAAAAMLTTACDAHSVPYQVQVAPSTPSNASPDTSHITIGFDSLEADAAIETDVANAAFDTAQEAGVDPNPVLAFAGALADGREPSSDVREAAGLERRPVVGMASNVVSEKENCRPSTRRRRLQTVAPGGM